MRHGMKFLHGKIVGTALLILIATLSLGQRAQTASQSNQTKPKATPSPTPPAGEEVDPDDVIRVKTSLVTSPVLVIGRSGKFVPSLKQLDFQIFDDGVQQEIAYFAPVETPVTIVLLIDTSRSTSFSLSEIQDAAIAVV